MGPLIFLFIVCATASSQSFSGSNSLRSPPLWSYRRQSTTIEPVAPPSCSPEEITTGCKLVGLHCVCGTGCRSEFLFRNRATCASALKERSSNICYHQPCERGICIQTQQDPGFSCKCEGTGYHGQRCEKACPLKPQYGFVFPHECIVI